MVSRVGHKIDSETVWYKYSNGLVQPQGDDERNVILYYMSADLTSLESKDREAVLSRRKKSIVWQARPGSENEGAL